MASDNFNRANESPIASPWSGASGEIASNQYVGNGSAIWRTDSATAFSEIQYVTVGASTGPAIHVTDANNHYYARDNGSGLFIRKGVGGTFSTISSVVGPTIAIGDIVSIRRSGTSIIIRKNGVDVVSATDTDLTGGYDGISAGVGVTVDNWKSLPFSFNSSTQQYIMAPAGTYDADSVWDSETEQSNFCIAPLVWSPSGLALTFDADGIPYIGGAYSGRQTFDYQEWDIATGDYVPVVGGGTTSTYVIGDEAPSLGTIPTQAWSAGVDSAYDLPITDADDALSTLTITGTINGHAITTSYNADGVRIVLHTYLSGDPGEYQRWRLEFHLANGAGSASGSVSNLTVTDPYGEAAVFAAFNWARTDGVQVPDIVGDTYATGLSTLAGVGLFGTQPVLALNGSVTAGNIISTSPAYPTYVDAGSLVSITVSGVAVPDVVGLTGAAAISLLQADGFVTSGSLLGTVTAQSPQSGELALPGATVSLTIGQRRTGAATHRRRRDSHVETPKRKPVQELQKVIDTAEAEHMVTVLLGPTASNKMSVETEQIVAPHAAIENPDSIDVDFHSLVADKEAVSELKAVWKRYSEKRRQMFNDLRESGYVWEE